MGGVFIEGDKVKFEILKNNYRNCGRIELINAFVGFSTEDNLDKVTEPFRIKYPQYNFISCDIDGLDLEVFEAWDLKADVVLIEGGFNWSPNFSERLPANIVKNNIQQSLAVIFSVAEKKGYYPVCFLQDTYLVDLKYKNLFCDIDNSPYYLYKDAYYFMGVNFRKHLNLIRKNNPIIRKYDSVNLERMFYDNLQP